VNGPRGRPFSPGNQLGKGRPKGSRNKWALEAQKLLEKYSEPVVSKCIAGALEGNHYAQRLCLERILPARRDNPFRLKLGVIQSSRDVARATEAIVQAVAEGRIPPSSGEALARMLEIQRHAIETSELEVRIAELEGNQKRDKDNI
jgi:hypothetical protein